MSSRVKQSDLNPMRSKNQLETRLCLGHVVLKSFGLDSTSYIHLANMGKKCIVLCFVFTVGVGNMWHKRDIIKAKTIVLLITEVKEKTAVHETMCYEPEHYLSHGRAACWVTTYNTPPVAIWQPALTATELLYNNLVVELLYFLQCFLLVCLNQPHLYGSVAKCHCNIPGNTLLFAPFPGPWTTKARHYIQFWCEQAVYVSRAWLIALRALDCWPNTSVRLCLEANISLCGKHQQPRSFSPQSHVEPDVPFLWTNTLNPVKDVFSLLLSSVPFPSHPSPSSSLSQFISISPHPLITFSICPSCSLSDFSPLCSFSLTPISPPLQNTNIAIHSLSNGRCSTGTLCLLSIPQTNGKHSKCFGMPSFHW